MTSRLFFFLLVVFSFVPSTNSTNFQLISDQVTGWDGDPLLETPYGCASSPTDLSLWVLVCSGQYTNPGPGPGLPSDPVSTVDVFSSATQIPYRLLPTTSLNSLMLPCGGGCPTKTLTLNTPTLAAGVAFLIVGDGGDSYFVPRGTDVVFNFADGTTNNFIIPTENQAGWIGQRLRCWSLLDGHSRRQLRLQQRLL
jgi:hypothetical protein